MLTLSYALLILECFVSLTHCLSVCLSVSLSVCLSVCKGAEDDEYGDGEGNDDEASFHWSMYLPIRLAPVILALKRSAVSSGTCSTSFSLQGITLAALQKAVEGDRIFPDEVSAGCTVTGVGDMLCVKTQNAIIDHFFLLSITLLHI